MTLSSEKFFKKQEVILSFAEGRQVHHDFLFENCLLFLQAAACFFDFSFGFKLEDNLV